MKTRWKLFLLCFLFLFITFRDLEARAKTDVVVLENGDRVSGEIKGLQRGLLSLKTDWMGTVSIEWKYIREIQSDFFFEVLSSDGQKSFGSLKTGEKSRKVEVISQSFAVEVDHLKVVGITPIEKRFLDRIDFSIEFGANYYSSNNSKKVSIGSDFKYRTERYGAMVDYNTIFNEQEAASRTRRNELKTNFQKFLSNNWSLITLANLLQSEELNLDLRTVFGGGVTKQLIQTNSLILSVLGGAAYNREKYIEKSFKNSAEGFSGLSFQTFQFDKPEMDITSSFFLIPSFTEWGRYRLELNVSTRFKLISDLYLRASLFENYDSQPPEGNIRNDFGVETTLGWSF